MHENHMCVMDDFVEDGYIGAREVMCYKCKVCGLDIAIADPARVGFEAAIRDAIENRDTPHPSVVLKTEDLEAAVGEFEAKAQSSCNHDFEWIGTTEFKKCLKCGVEVGTRKNRDTLDEQNP